jgi:photosystem II stability/assembly factor-like uncharacterized protein
LPSIFEDRARAGQKIAIATFVNTRPLSTLRITLLTIAILLCAGTARASTETMGMTAIAVSPDGAVVLAGSPAGVYRSTDGGKSFSQVLPPRGENFVVASVAFDPASRDAFAATAAGLFRSDDSGATWSDADLLGGTMPGKIVFDPTKKSTLYVATADGLYVTGDRGAKWQEISPNGRHFSIRSLSLRAKPITLYAINEEGLFASTDRGASWNALIDERDDLSSVAFEPPSTLHLSANGAHYLRSVDGGTNWERESQQWPHFSDFFVVAGNVYAAAKGATWRSTDAGKSWAQWKSDDEFPVSTLVADPKQRSVVWAAGTRGISTSADGGKSWVVRSRPAVSTAQAE